MLEPNVVLKENVKLEPLHTLLNLFSYYLKNKNNKSSLPQLEDTLWAGLTDLHIKIPMGITAENLAEKYQITREDCDNYAYQTQQRWKAGNV